MKCSLCRSESNSQLLYPTASSNYVRCCCTWKRSGGRLNIKMPPYQDMDPMLKIRRSRDRLIFNMRIHTPGKDGLYIEKGDLYPINPTLGLPKPGVTWWRHQMETFSALLAICAGNSPASGEFPAQRPVTRSFDVFFDLCLNKRLRKQSWGWWFQTLSRPLWCHCNEEVVIARLWIGHTRITRILSRGHLTTYHHCVGRYWPLIISMA